MRKAGHPTSTNPVRARQLQEAKRRQRAKQRVAGMVHVQLTVPRSTADRIAVARRSGELDRVLKEALDRNVICVSEYPQLMELMWNRSDALISAREAFQLYERNWRFVRDADLQPQERELIDRLAKDFGGGVINA